MARYVATVAGRRPVDEAFGYLADMSNAPDWDPGVATAERLGSGPLGPGEAFRLMVTFLGRRVPFEYRIVAFDPPRRVVVQAENGMLRSTDEIRVEAATGGGCTVTYDARLEPRGLAVLAGPLLVPMFRRIGDRAMVGLRAALSA